MHPYRELPIEPPLGKSRSYLKTLYWKLLLRVKGTWKKRYYRGCGEPGCNKVHTVMSGDLIDFQQLWCQMKHDRVRVRKGGNRTNWHLEDTLLALNKLPMEEKK